ncbi:MAG: CRISPR-associated endonuclease Cas2 [Patescibacteria group bacterium]|nr:CRISPR-associated endonuclease Cas2 [Patescibacteria group bacterium]
MNKIKLKQSAIVGRQVLLYFVDFYRYAIPIFDKARVYRIPFKEYDKFRLKDKIKFSQEIYRLKRAGVVKKYIDEKGEFIEVTPKGQKWIKKYFVDQLEIKLPSKWDKKWRIVIFDIPDTKKNERDILREKLERIGFIKLQESVYVFPFECGLEIEALKEMYFIKPYVQYVLANRIETEINLLEVFYDRGILDKKYLRN